MSGNTMAGGPGGSTVIITIPGHTPEGTPAPESILIEVKDPLIKKVSLTRRKRNISDTVLLTVNANTVVLVNGIVT